MYVTISGTHCIIIVKTLLWWQLQLWLSTFFVGDRPQSST